MRLRIKRRIRTSSSEQWTLFDADRMDDSGQPTNVGKMDIHYDPEMVYATLLLWSEFTGNLEESTVQEIIDDLVDEMTEPVGVPGDYSLDFFSPSLADYKFLTSYEEDEDEDEEEWEEDEEDEEEEDTGERNGKARWD